FEEAFGRAVRLQYVNTASDDVGDIEKPVGADLQPVGDRIGSGQAAEVLDAAVQPTATDATGVGLAPDDRAIRLDRYAIRKCRLIKANENACPAVGLDHKDVAGVGIGRIVGAGIGEDQPAVGSEHEVV